MNEQHTTDAAPNAWVLGVACTSSDEPLLGTFLHAVYGIGTMPMISAYAPASPRRRTRKSMPIAEIVGINKYRATGPASAEYTVLSEYMRAFDAAEDARVFARLADEWRRETRHLSSSHALAMHPAYQRIIGMGKRALPLILRDLERRLDHWFWALTVIARESPVAPSEAGQMQLMRQRWLDWGRKQGYLA